MRSPAGPARTLAGAPSRGDLAGGAPQDCEAGGVRILLPGFTEDPRCAARSLTLCLIRAQRNRRLDEAITDSRGLNARVLPHHTQSSPRAWCGGRVAR